MSAVEIAALTLSSVSAVVSLWAVVKLRGAAPPKAGGLRR